MEKERDNMKVGTNKNKILEEQETKDGKDRKNRQPDRQKNQRRIQ